MPEMFKIGKKNINVICSITKLNMKTIRNNKKNPTKQPETRSTDKNYSIQTYQLYTREGYYYRLSVSPQKFMFVKT